jgi:hypothetical protein
MSIKRINDLLNLSEKFLAHPEQFNEDETQQLIQAIRVERRDNPLFSKNPPREKGWQWKNLWIGFWQGLFFTVGITIVNYVIHHF